MAKGWKRDRSRDRAAPSVERPRAQRVTGPALEVPALDAASPTPAPARRLAAAAALTGATKVKKKCCRSRPRCKGCPVVIMRAARLQESGLTGKDLKKAVKRARAA